MKKPLILLCLLAAIGCTKGGGDATPTARRTIDIESLPSYSLTSLSILHPRPGVECLLARGRNGMAISCYRVSLENANGS